jgi:hypothetical protein
VPSPKKEQIVEDVRRKVAYLSVDDLIPMPHYAGTSKTKVSAEEREEYLERFRRYTAQNPKYLESFFRPPAAAVNAAWSLITGSLTSHPEMLRAIISAVKDSRDDRPESERGHEARASFVILLALLVGDNSEPHDITFNDVFDAVSKRYSDHYIRSPARKVRDMLPVRVKNCRRDLLVNYIDINKLWRFLIHTWPNQGGNPFYTIDIRGIINEEQDKTGVTKRRVKTRYVSTSMSGSPVDEFRSIVERYNLIPSRGIRLAFVNPNLHTTPAGDDAIGAQAQAAARYCAEVPYNQIKIGRRSKDILKVQANTILLFDVDEFTRDFEIEKRKASSLLNELKKRGIDATLSNKPRKTFGDSDKKDYWSLREADVYYHSIEYALTNMVPDERDTILAEEKYNRDPDECDKRCEAFWAWVAEQESRTVDRVKSALTSKEVIQAAVCGWRWRQEVRNLLSRYDSAASFIQMYRAVHKQLDTKSGLIPIRSDFYRAVNRRYQPRHLWPTYVSNKDVRRAAEELNGSDNDNAADYDDDDLSGPIDDGPENSYRQRWFKAPHPITENACRLVGFDISSSQTQIVATFLSSAKLEQDTMETKTGASFKEILARLAFEKHLDPADKFKLRTVNSYNPTLENYHGAGDTRLQNLCKRLWMTMSYGGNVCDVVREQRNDPDTYGPGWTYKDAGQFVSSINRRYPSMQAFLSACKHAANMAIAQDQTAGIRLVDPSDESEIRWNPVARKDRYIDIGKNKLTISLPATWTISDDNFPTIVEYPVDPESLRRMLAPCFVHMLDAFYSTIVMEKLAEHGIKNFVGIHDCWLVPETVLCNGKECHGLDILRQVMRDAAAEWYQGLEPAYEALLGYVQGHAKFERLINDAYDHWKQRVSGGYVPPFLAKAEKL